MRVVGTDRQQQFRILLRPFHCDLHCSTGSTLAAAVRELSGIQPIPPALRTGAQLPRSLKFLPPGAPVSQHLPRLATK
jgi:hypothetical protein